MSCSLRRSSEEAPTKGRSALLSSAVGKFSASLSRLCGINEFSRVGAEMFVLKGGRGVIGVDGSADGDGDTVC
jgi:hypothetical protein